MPSPGAGSRVIVVYGGVTVDGININSDWLRAHWDAWSTSEGHRRIWPSMRIRRDNDYAGCSESYDHISGLPRVEHSAPVGYQHYWEGVRNWQTELAIRCDDVSGTSTVLSWQITNSNACLATSFDPLQVPCNVYPYKALVWSILAAHYNGIENASSDLLRNTGTFMYSLQDYPYANLIQLDFVEKSRVADICIQRNRGSISAVEDDGTVASLNEPTIISSWPNPTSGRSTLSFRLTSTGSARLTVYDIRGRRVRDLVTDRLPTGTNSIQWDGKDNTGQPVSAGVYFYQLVTGGKSYSQKIVLLR